MPTQLTVFFATNSVYSSPTTFSSMLLLLNHKVTGRGKNGANGVFWPLFLRHSHSYFTHTCKLVIGGRPSVASPLRPCRGRPNLATLQPRIDSVRTMGKQKADVIKINPTNRRGGKRDSECVEELANFFSCLTVRRHRRYLARTLSLAPKAACLSLTHASLTALHAPSCRNLGRTWTRNAARSARR
jgi:hypothetical protein